MPRPALFLRVELGSGRLGPGKVALLEHIRDSRSLAAAARAMGMSYKRAWELLAALNAMFDEPVAVTHPGRNVAGATELTPFGERVVALFRAVEVSAARATAKAVDELAAASRRMPAGGPPGAARPPRPARASAVPDPSPTLPRDPAPAAARRRAAPPT
jgi:molybdate transport system regulatory protein